MANAINMQASTDKTVTSEKKAVNTINKLKYKILNDRFDQLFDQRSDPQLKDEVLAIIRDVLKFDPEMTSYDKEKIKQRCIETGKNTYQMYTQKYYEEHKNIVNSKRTQKRREEAMCKLVETK
jgi:hypothetical protein